VGKTNSGDKLRVIAVSATMREWKEKTRFGNLELSQSDMRMINRKKN
jgi:hypothetical protein